MEQIEQYLTGIVHFLFPEDASFQRELDQYLGGTFRRLKVLQKRGSSRHVVIEEPGKDKHSISFSDLVEFLEDELRLGGQTALYICIDSVFLDDIRWVARLIEIGQRVADTNPDWHGKLKMFVLIKNGQKTQVPVE